MEYLGEFLSPTNSIGKEQDKLVKYFYFRPDKYDDPDADLENIFVIKTMDEFPKRLDLLTENELYAIESIEVSKKINDDQIGVKDVSYVVTATYDLLENIKKREKKSGSDDAEEEEEKPVDENGKIVTSETKPWELQAKWTFQPVEVVIPFIKGYNMETYEDTPTVDIVTTAGQRIVSETKKFQLEITYIKSYQFTQSWDTISGCFINDEEFDLLQYDYHKVFPKGTLLISPPSWDVDWYIDTATSGIQTPISYRTYTVKMLYDPDGHDKNLLNIGTMAKFGGNLPFEQIYVISVSKEDGTILDGYPKYTSMSDALRDQATQLNNGNLVTVEAVTEQLPLTEAGTIDLNAISDPTNNPYHTLTFRQYRTMNFNLLPFKN